MTQYLQVSGVFYPAPPKHTYHSEPKQTQNHAEPFQIEAVRFFWKANFPDA